MEHYYLPIKKLKILKCNGKKKSRWTAAFKICLSEAINKTCLINLIIIVV